MKKKSVASSGRPRGATQSHSAKWPAPVAKYLGPCAGAKAQTPPPPFFLTGGSAVDVAQH